MARSDHRQCLFGCRLPVQRLEVVEAGVESVQTDVRELTEERQNIRRAFNDLTVQLANCQV